MMSRDDSANLEDILSNLVSTPVPAPSDDTSVIITNKEISQINQTWETNRTDLKGHQTQTFQQYEWHRDMCQNLHKLLRTYAGQAKAVGSTNSCLSWIGICAGLLTIISTLAESLQFVPNDQARIIARVCGILGGAFSAILIPTIVIICTTKMESTLKNAEAEATVLKR